MWNKEQIKAALAANDGFVCRALVQMFNRQTADEQEAKITCHENGIGFNGLDAEFLSSLAVQYIKRGTLSPKQISYARKGLMKYAGQIAQIANEMTRAGEDGEDCEDDPDEAAVEAKADREVVRAYPND